MDDTTKILTVSYGNFSCHLEGFDDSVETMKTVVSFFHELAGHDRFMDVEPQAPDMETLARLTEDQTGVPVEVDGVGNNVSLRAAPVAAAADAIQDADELVVDDVVNDQVEVTDEIVLNTEPQEDIPADDDSVAAKLQRIRAVVDRGDVAADVADDAQGLAEDTFTEDLADEAPEAPVPGNPLAQRLAELAKRNSERAAEEAGIILEADEGEDAALTPEELAELEAEFAAEEAMDDAVEEIAAMEDDVADLQDAMDTAEEDIIDAMDDVAVAEDEIADFAEAAFDDAPTAEDLAEVEDVIEDAADAGPLVLTDAAPVGAADDFADDLDSEDDLAEAQDEASEQDEARPNLRDNVDDNMSRILSQTDEHLAEPEGRRHRDAFAQLKAAVAATEAARQLGDPGATERDKNEVFRDDLGALGAEEAQEKAAQPEDAAKDVADALSDDVTDTPVAGEDIAAEPPQDEVAEEKAAPAPLKLVSSQAVNAPAGNAPAGNALDAASNRLRKIADQKDTGGKAKDGFTEFAAMHGATELANLLEAAAAYICIVEGEDDFSRPQVMKKVQLASATEFSREDGLRAFGKLLRMNRLAKLSNGRFQVAPDTRFLPEGQAAQG